MSIARCDCLIALALAFLLHLLGDRPELQQQFAPTILNSINCVLRRDPTPRSLHTRGYGWHYTEPRAYTRDI